MYETEAGSLKIRTEATLVKRHKEKGQQEAKDRKRKERVFFFNTRFPSKVSLTLVFLSHLKSHPLQNNLPASCTCCTDGFVGGMSSRKKHEPEQQVRFKQQNECMVEERLVSKAITLMMMMTVLEVKRSRDSTEKIHRTHEP